MRLARILALLLLCGAGCAGRGHVPIQFRKDPPCVSASGVAWAGPEAPEHRERLSSWCMSVGPPVVEHRTPQARSGLTVVTWNKHEGYGDLKRLLNSLDQRSAVVALLQEVSRKSDRVPRDAAPKVKVPGWIGPRNLLPSDISAIAEEFNMSLVYLPSMPNGAGTEEDRGCAILSTLPISDVVGIEMPWVKQRRVAVMATITATKNGLPWRIRVVSIHLENRPRRRQQAAALADFLVQQTSSGLPIIIGGDLNAWWGTHDQAVHEIDRVVPRIRHCTGATFRFGFLSLRLDHLFSNLPENQRTGCFVAPDRFQSDHHPIILHVGT